MKRNWTILITLVLIFPLLLTACAPEESNQLMASGFLSAVEASVAPELSGRVLSISVEEGQTVTQGQSLFQLDDEYIIAQRDQASAAVQAAEAAVEAAQRQADSARAQYELALQGSLAQEMQTRQTAWAAPVLENFRPNWYFQKDELLSAAQNQVDAAIQELAANTADLDAELASTSSKDFVAAEERLAEAQLAYTIAQQTLTQVQSVNDTHLTDAATEAMDAAQAELDAALLDYQRMLTTTSAESVLEARARVSVSQIALDNANATLLGLQTGDKSPQVKAAYAAVLAAESLVGQAETGLAQAQQALNLAELQLDRTIIKAPLDGILLSRNLEVGELAVAGGTVMQIAQIDTLDLIVYLPEDQYGRVMIGDTVLLKVDSYPDQQFSGEIIHISDEAEFTPRNVQTEQGRKATVYAVKITVLNPDHLLKPGMPADATFTLH